MSNLVGWRYAALWAGVVGAIGAATYPIIIQPYLSPKGWQEVQKKGRAGINQEDIQPGGMKVWTDPFDRKKEP